MGDESDEDEKAEFPSNFKRFTIQDRKNSSATSNERETHTPGISYDGLEDAKQIGLAEPGEEPKLVWDCHGSQPGRGAITCLYSTRVSRCFFLEL